MKCCLYDRVFKCLKGVLSYVFVVACVHCYKLVTFLFSILGLGSKSKINEGSSQNKKQKHKKNKLKKKKEKLKIQEDIILEDVDPLSPGCLPKDANKDKNKKERKQKQKNKKTQKDDNRDLEHVIQNPET